MWKIRLLGGPRLWAADGVEVRRMRSQRVSALLAYLCLHLGQDCSREILSEALWPDDDPHATANRLRVSLTALRQLLEPSPILSGAVIDTSRSGFVRLRADAVWCDVTALHQALRDGDTATALQLAAYGKLLPGLYDDWVLEHQEAIAELCAALPKSVSALPTVPEPRLPTYLTRFFGRETEQELLAEALESCRLVTVLSPGGMGKSRLVVEFARQRRHATAFVALADLPSDCAVDTILAQVFRALERATPASGALFPLLTDLLCSRGDLLLILDNAEHVSQTVRPLVHALLETVPTLRILVTSRQTLDIAGEQVVPLPPLELPQSPTMPERLQEFPAVALFCDRVQRVRPGFVLSERQVPAVLALCARLEGMPLALELAAARARSQTPAEIATALAEGVLTLASTQEGIPHRHQSLSNLIQSSVDLLPDDVRRFFLALSVFRDGWTAEGAAAVTQCPDAARYLDELVQRSLVTATEDSYQPQMRFGFLDSLRQFAEAHCRERPSLEERYRLHFLAVAAAAYDIHSGSFDALESDLENVVIALERSWEVGPTSDFWKALVGFLKFAFVRGYHRRTYVWLDRVLDSYLTLPHPLGRLIVVQAALTLLSDLGRHDQILQHSAWMLREAQENQLLEWQVRALLFQGYVADQEGDFQLAHQTQLAALRLAREQDDRDALVSALVLAGRALLSGATRQTSVSPTEAKAYLEEAQSYFEEGLTLAQGNSFNIALMEMGAALAIYWQGDKARGYQRLKQAQRWACEQGILAAQLYAFWYETVIEIEDGSPERAALLYGIFRALYDRMSFSLQRQINPDEHRDRLRSLLGDALFEQQLRLAQQISLEQMTVPRSWEELVAGKHTVTLMS